MTDGPWRWRCPRGHAALTSERGDGQRGCKACNQTYPEEQLVDMLEVGNEQGEIAESVRRGVNP